MIASEQEIIIDFIFTFNYIIRQHQFVVAQKSF